MKVSFFSIDDSESKHTISLTAVKVPLDKYNCVRNELYEFTCNLNPENDVRGRPLELHGAELLKGFEWATDDIRIKCFEKIVEIVNIHKLKIYRTGFFKNSVRPLLGCDPRLYSINFSNMQTIIGHFSDQEIAIPIIDGLHEEGAKPFNKLGQSLSIMGNSTIADYLLTKSTGNICEPLFASSRYSAIIQIADMTSYMMQCLDYKFLNIKCGKFKQNVQDIAQTFNCDLVINEIMEAFAKDKQ